MNNGFPRTKTIIRSIGGFFFLAGLFFSVAGGLSLFLAPDPVAFLAGLVVYPMGCLLIWGSLSFLGE